MQGKIVRELKKFMDNMYLMPIYQKEKDLKLKMMIQMMNF